MIHIFHLQDVKAHEARGGVMDDDDQVKSNSPSVSTPPLQTGKQTCQQIFRLTGKSIMVNKR